MERILKIIVSQKHTPTTAGQFLSIQTGLSKKQISQAKFRPNGITKNGKQCRITEPVIPGDILTICLEEANSGSEHLEKPANNLPPLKILYEDQDILAVNKPSGIVTHPSGKHFNDSLSNQVFWYFQNKKETTTIRSIGRLDKETSGIVVFAKNQTAAARLQTQRNTTEYEKEYLAVISGYLPSDTWHTIKLPIAPDPTDSRKMLTVPPQLQQADSKYSKTAVTHYRVLYSCSHWSLVSLRLDTGRTHQIRIHMKAIGHPLLGDTLYADTASVPVPFSFTRAALHAWHVTLIHPFEKRMISIEAEFPEDFLPLKKYMAK